MTTLIGFVERLLWAIRWKNRMTGGGRDNRRGRKKSKGNVKFRNYR